MPKEIIPEQDPEGGFGHMREERNRRLEQIP
jgi:hypothetical protein